MPVLKDQVDDQDLKAHPVLKANNSKLQFLLHNTFCHQNKIL